MLGKKLQTFLLKNSAVYTLLISVKSYGVKLGSNNITPYLAVGIAIPFLYNDTYRLVNMEFDTS